MEEMKPYLAAILMQIINSGMYMASKAAFNSGMSSFVFIFYRQGAGSLLLASLAMIFERKSAVPMSLKTFCKILMLSLFGITLSSNVNGIALVYTSSTLASAITNCLPVMTFILAVVFRIEKLKLSAMAGVAKVVGLALCMAGVATFAFYKGPHLKPFLHHHPFQNTQQQPDDHGTSLGGANWVKGCFLMFVSTISWAWWLIFQTQVLEEYPLKLTFMSLQGFLSAVCTLVLAVAVERDSSRWRLGWNIRLAAVAYSAFMVIGVGYYAQAWVLQKKGPVFQAMWTPLGLVITLFCSQYLLGEVISLGSVLGGIFLVGSLYCVLWAKSKEEEKLNVVKKNSDNESGNPPKAEAEQQECPESETNKTSRDIADQDSTAISKL